MGLTIDFIFIITSFNSKTTKKIISIFMLIFKWGHWMYYVMDSTEQLLWFHLTTMLWALFILFWCGFLVGFFFYFYSKLTKVLFKFVLITIFCEIVLKIHFWRQCILKCLQLVCSGKCFRSLFFELQST
jgi:hypothetical protein